MPKESKKDAPAGKPAPKGQGKAAAQPVAQTTKNQRDNRYLRAARVIIKAGEGEATDPMRIVAEAQLSAASAAYCLEAFKGVTAALREAGILPAKAASAERPNVPAEEAAEAAA